MTEKVQKNLFSFVIWLPFIPIVLHTTHTVATMAGCAQERHQYIPSHQLYSNHKHDDTGVTHACLLLNALL